MVSPILLILALKIYGSTIDPIVHKYKYKYPEYKNSTYQEHLRQTDLFLKINDFNMSHWEKDQQSGFMDNGTGVYTVQESNHLSRYGTSIVDAVKSKCEFPGVEIVMKIPKTKNNTVYITEPYLYEYFQDIRLDEVNIGLIYKAETNDAMYTAIIRAFKDYYDIRQFENCCKGCQYRHFHLCGDHVLAQLVSDGKKVGYYFESNINANTRVCVIRGFGYWLQLWCLILTPKTFFGYFKAVEEIIKINMDLGVWIRDLGVPNDFTYHIMDEIRTSVPSPSGPDYYQQVTAFINRNYNSLVDVDLKTFTRVLTESQQRMENYINREL